MEIWSVHNVYLTISVVFIKYCTRIQMNLSVGYIIIIIGMGWSVYIPSKQNKIANAFSQFGSQKVHI